MINLDAEHRLAEKFLGYTGEKSRPSLDNFYKSNPSAAARMGKYQKAVMGMAEGGISSLRPRARPTAAPSTSAQSTGTQSPAQDSTPSVRPRARPTDATAYVNNEKDKSPNIQQESKSVSIPKDTPRPVKIYDRNSGQLVASGTEDDIEISDQSVAQAVGGSKSSLPNFLGGVQSYLNNLPIQVGNVNLFSRDPLANFDVTYGDERSGQFVLAKRDDGAGLYYKKKFNQGGMVKMQQGGAVPFKDQDITGKPVIDYFSPPEATGQAVTKHTSTPIPSWVQPPPPGTPVSMAFETLTNPETGETFNAPTGGYTIKGSSSSGTGAPSYTKDIIPKFGQTVQQTLSPVQAGVEKITPTAGTEIAETAGQVTPTAPTATAEQVGTVATAQGPVATDAAAYQAGTASDAVQAETAKLQAEQEQVSQQVIAAQQNQSAVSGLEASQGTAHIMQNPVQREIQAGELISGAADAQKAAVFTEQIQAAQARPSQQATVQGQLDGLMQQFEGGDKTPAWAAGAMRAATAQMAARGLGASSMAGQAIIQAAMESAIPIAQADAQTIASFEAQNLSNRQQRAMLAAQQRAQFLGQEFDQAFQARVQNSARIGDIANMNFTAEQNIALENSRAVNTMNLANLNNRQAMVMAEAAALSQLDMSNLNNRQQAAVQNAQSFLQMDMANLGNRQQTTLFTAQQNIQSMFTDQAAENAARQFNATSKGQTDQFFASLASQTSQFNANQVNALNQFNVSAENAIRQFNSNLQDQRDRFNANNGLVIAQANAQWRQNIETINTAAQNQSNQEFAKVINDLTDSNLDAIWQRERDLMEYNFESSEDAKDRAMNLILGDMDLQALRERIAYAEDQGKTSFLFKFLFDIAGFGK
jgi:hypothetical protein